MISLAVMYELVIVAKVDKSDQLVSRVEKALKDAVATNLKIERLGKKQLAYPIRKQTDANYFVFNFDAEASAIGGFASKLRLEQEDLLRYLIIKKKQVKIKSKKAAKNQEVETKTSKLPKVTVVTKTTTAKLTSKRSQTKNKASNKKVTKIKKGKK